MVEGYASVAVRVPGVRRMMQGRFSVWLCLAGAALSGSCTSRRVFHSALIFPDNFAFSYISDSACYLPTLSFRTGLCLCGSPLLAAPKSPNVHSPLLKKQALAMNPFHMSENGKPETSFLP